MHFLQKHHSSHITLTNDKNDIIKNKTSDGHTLAPNAITVNTPNALHSDC